MGVDRRRQRSRRHRLFALVFFTILFVVQEVTFRLTFPLPEVIGFNRVHYQLLAREDSRSGPIFKRGLVYDRLSFESQPDGFAEIHQLNLYGFRGGDFTIDPPTGRRRFLILGDSVVEGEGASESATIPAVFTKLLRSDGDQAEVINLGVVAASLNELTPLARDSIALLKPTDVILVLFANDLPTRGYSNAFDEPAPEYRRDGGRRFMPRVFDLLIRLAYSEPTARRWPPHPSIPFFLPVPDSTNPWTHFKYPPLGLAPAIHQAMTAGKMNPWLWEQSKIMPGMLSHDFAVK